MGSSHGSRPESNIERLPLPQELLEHMSAVQTRPSGMAASPRRGDDSPKGRGFVTLDGAFSDGYRYRPSRAPEKELPLEAGRLRRQSSSRERANLE